MDLMSATIFVELHHLQLLILDDIMDEDEFRRKARTVHRFFTLFEFSPRESRHSSQPAQCRYSLSPELKIN